MNSRTNHPGSALPHRAGRIAALLLAALIATLPLQAPAQGAATDASTASSVALSLPVAAVAVSSLVVIGTAGALVVVSVQASATGTAWVLERASDGSRVVLNFSGDAARTVSTATGRALTVVTLSTGHMLMDGSRVVCFVPNEIGRPLLHHERLDQ
ncbi:MAG: hypothetical protein RJA44_1803 [Pseudomonadota bacterium]